MPAPTDAVAARARSREYLDALNVDVDVSALHVDDVANLCVEAAGRGDNFTVNAVGPETMTFEQMVRSIRSAVGSRSRIIHVPVRSRRRRLPRSAWSFATWSSPITSSVDS